MPINEIHIHTITNIVVLIAVSSHGERRSQIIPVGVAPRVAGSRVRLSPEKQERFGAHADLRDTAQDSSTVCRSECLETLDQAKLIQVGRALGGGRLRQIGPLLRPGHDLPIEVKLGLLSGGKSLHSGVGTAGEDNKEAQQQYGPMPVLAACSHGGLLLPTAWITMIYTPSRDQAPEDRIGHKYGTFSSAQHRRGTEVFPPGAGLLHRTDRLGWEQRQQT